MNGQRDNSEAAERSHETHRATGRRAELRFRRRSLLFVSLGIFVLLGLLVPLIIIGRRAARWEGCQSNLKQIGLALQNYHDIYKAFPPAITYSVDGTPMHSWRVLIAPYVVQNAFYDAYDRNEVWNGSNNMLLMDEIPDVLKPTFGEEESRVVYDASYFHYRCPSASAAQHRMCTNYVALIDDRPGKLNGPPNRPGSIPPGLDAESGVIVIEIADSDICWMEPRDLLLSALSIDINDRSARSLSSYHGSACIAHADGSVEILDDDATDEYVRRLLTQ
jgi:hypothetical protein